MYSVKETARTITCPTESDEVNLKRIVRYLKGRSECKEPDRYHYTFEVCERVYRQRIGQDKQQRARAQVAELCSGEMQHSQHGHEHSKQ